MSFKKYENKIEGQEVIGTRWDGYHVLDDNNEEIPVSYNETIRRFEIYDIWVSEYLEKNMFIEIRDEEDELIATFKGKKNTPKFIWELALAFWGYDNSETGIENIEDIDTLAIVFLEQIEEEL
jgi:hypothetical protein